MTPEEFDALPAGTVVRTHHGSQWTKKPSGMWHVDSDPEWGPHTSRDIPAYAEVVADDVEHAWFTVQFNYGGWIECECGFRPFSQEDMDSHIPVEEPG